MSVATETTSDLPQISIAMKPEEIPMISSGTELSLAVRTQREMTRAREWFKNNSTEEAFVGQLWFFCRFYIRKPPRGTNYGALDADVLNMILITIADILASPQAAKFNSNTKNTDALMKILEAEVQSNDASKQMHTEIGRELRLRIDWSKI
jgi:hypothetical protein